ncbi:hypothetical protein CJ738_36525, partial [Klebsiella pneumoniae]
MRTFGFYNAGQDCTAACRIYAQQGIYDQLVDIDAVVDGCGPSVFTTPARTARPPAGSTPSRVSMTSWW